jgi:hypothetical protein
MRISINEVSFDFMPRTILLFLFLYLYLRGAAQHDFFLFRDRNKTIARYETGSYITFQLNDLQWYHGQITRVTSDSFFVHRMVIRRSLMGSDTVHYGIIHLAFGDVRAMPRKKAMFYFEGDNVKLIYGKQSWVYVKNGLIFQMAGAGFVLLNVTNSLIKNDPPFQRKNITSLVAGAAVFSVGQFLHSRYKPTLRMGARYRFKYVQITS